MALSLEKMVAEQMSSKSTLVSKLIRFRPSKELKMAVRMTVVLVTASAYLGYSLSSLSESSQVVMLTLWMAVSLWWSTTATTPFLEKLLRAESKRS
jgi:hypothetical protein